MKTLLPGWLLVAGLALVGIPASASVGPTVVRTGNLLDVDSGKLLAEQAVTFKDGRVVAVRPWSAVAAGADNVLDWSALRCCPA